MKKFNKAGTFTTVVAGATLLAVFGGGSAVAGSLITSAQIKDNTIKGVDVYNGGLKGEDIKNSSLKGEDIIDGGIKSADVKNGSLTNDDISVYNVTVNSDGTIEYSSGGVTVIRVNEGAYRVFMPRNVQACSVAVTAANADAVFAPQANFGLADVNSHPEAFVVAARNMTDNNDPIDVGFHAVVVC